MHSSELAHDWLGPVPLSEIGESHNGALSPDTPLWFRKQEAEDGIKYQVLFQQEVIGVRLFSILSAICNAHSAKDAVLIDWEQIYRPRTAGDRYLRRIHIPLGKPWFQFLDDLRLFYHTLNGSDKEYNQYTIKLLSEGNTSVTHLFKLMEITRDEMKEILAEDSHMPQKGKMNEIRKRTIEMVERQESPTWQRLLEGHFERMEGGLLLPREHADLKVFFPQKTGETLHKRIVIPGSSTQRDISALRVERLIIRFTEELRHLAKTMVGLLEWETDSAGKRNILTGQAPVADQAVIKEMIFPDDPTKSNSIAVNRILGLLQLATLEPNITKNWPKQMPLPGREKLQVVGEAQIPVFTLRSKRAFERGEVIAGLEKKAGELAAKTV